MNKKLVTILLWLLALILSIIFLPQTRAKAEAPEMTYDQKLDAWIYQVMEKESGGKKLLVVLDTNNKYSYGCLQYQMTTWNYYSKKYDIDAEIMDCDAQIEVTRNIIKYEKDGWRNWWTTVVKKGVGKPPVM